MRNPDAWQAKAAYLCVMLVSLSEQWLEPGMGATQFEDWVGSQEWGQALSPVVVAASEFAFGLGGA